MKYLNPRNITALGLLGCWAMLISLHSHAGKEGYYRWKDDTGEVHFTQQPPLGRQYDFIETRGGANVVNNNAAAESADGQVDDGGAATAAPKKMEVLPPKDPVICSQAKSNLLTLQKSGARIRVTDPDGTSRLLNDEEVAEQKRRAQEAVGIHCP